MWHGARMKTLNRDNGYVDMRLVTFAGVVFGIASFITVVVMWFVRMLVL